MGGWRAREGGREEAEGAGGRVGEFTFKEGEEKMELEEGDGRDEFANRGREKKTGGGTVEVTAEYRPRQTRS